MKGALLLAGTVAFRGATLIDGTGSPPRQNALLVVSEGRILSVGDASVAALAALPAGCEIRDLSGRWIVPGLLDAHVHAESEADLEEMFRWGVTGVRLMAEDVSAAATLASTSRNRPDLPDVFPAAPIFTARGGWWDEGQVAGTKLDRFPATPGEAREAVGRAKALGSSEIKLMLDDMAWCRAPRPALARMSAEVASALIGEARRNGMRAVVHAPNLADAKAAIEAGATALAHGVLDPIDAGTVERMRASSVVYIPTMDVFEFIADPRAFVDGVLSDPVTTRPLIGLAQETVARYRSRTYSDGYRDRYPNFDNVKRSLTALRRNLVRLHAAGVPVALGTDMWAFPGLGVSVEMDLFVRAGLSPLEAIRAATRTSARSLGVEKDRGTLEPGKRADFLLLADDPIRDVRNVRRIIEICKNGHCSRRPVLRRSAS